MFSLFIVNLVKLTESIEVQSSEVKQDLPSEQHKNKTSTKQFNNKSVKKSDEKSTKLTFTCNVCIKTFGRKDHLNRHIMHVHEGVRSHQCKVCGKSFHEKGGF